MRHRIKRKIKKNQQNNFTLEIQKQAAEKLQQLVNENYTEEDVKRAMNSYNSPDEVNRVDWNQVTLKKELIDKIAKLIERKRTV